MKNLILVLLLAIIAVIGVAGVLTCFYCGIAIFASDLSFNGILNGSLYFGYAVGIGIVTSYIGQKLYKRIYW